ncbi:hypothetical protein PTKIN_Ptkin17bG0040500 [Pterospermum kingtungense]
MNIFLARAGTQSVGLNKNERYYYCKRESDSREVRGRGWWKATSHVKTISADNGQVLGYKRPLTFHRFRDNLRNRKDAIKTHWIMHEYSLHSIPTEWRLCKIKYNGKERLEEDMIMDDVRSSLSPPLMNSEAGSGTSSIDPMQFENSASEEDQQQQQPLMPPLPVNNDYENYISSSSNVMRIFDELMIDDQQQPISSSSDIPSSSMPILTPSHHHLALQDNQYSDPMEQPFPDLWSS